MNKLILILFLLLIYYKSYSYDFITSIEYNKIDNQNSIFSSFKLSEIPYSDLIGIKDNYNYIDINLGIKNENKIKFAYNISAISYHQFFRLPILKRHNEGKLYHNNVFNHNPLDREGLLFLTFSYKGPTLKNVGLFNRDFNWSSIGADVLYANFDNVILYNRFSLNGGISSIQNNSMFCNNNELVAKNNNVYDLMLKNSIFNIQSINGVKIQLQLDTYYRLLYASDYQQIISSNFNVSYLHWFNKEYNLLRINCNLGYLKYNYNNSWNDYFSFNFGLSYIFTDL